MATGFSFIDDPQMSVREKIDRYFQKKNSDPVVLDESTSDESIVSSFCEFDQSFAEILNNNPHVTLIRNSKKGNATQTDVHNKPQQCEPQEHHEDKFEETLQRSPPPSKPQKAPYMPTPTRRGEVRKPIKTDDSIELDPLDLWYVSDESFLEMEKSCQSFRENDVNDTTLLYDVQEPSFLVNSIDFDNSLDDSVFEHRRNMSYLSPMQQVAMRRPSTILEESTIQSINSSDERSGSSLSLKHSVREVDDAKKSPAKTLPRDADANKSNKSSTKSRSYRPSLLNVFPTRSRIGFYDNFDSTSAYAEPSAKQNKENAINLMRFESVDRKSPTSSVKPSVNQRSGKENSINLMRFESLDLQSPPASPLKPTTHLSANRNRNPAQSLIDSSIVEEASSSLNLSVDQTQQNSSMSDSEPPDQFNDTLEAVDYYMKQGKKIMDKTIASTTLHQQPCVVASPKNRNNSLLKQTLARTHLMSVNSDTKLAKKSLF